MRLPRALDCTGGGRDRQQVPRKGVLVTHTVKERHHERLVWNLSSDGQSLPYSDLFDALETGLILGGSATSFSMKDGPAVVIFHGQLYCR